MAILKRINEIVVHLLRVRVFEGMLIGENLEKTYNLMRFWCIFSLDFIFIIVFLKETILYRTTVII